MTDEEDVPDSDINEPRITDATEVEEDPKCVWCGDPAEFDQELHIVNGKVITLMKRPTLYDDREDNAGPLCSSCYSDTSSYAYWRQYDHDENAAQERRMGIDY